MKIILTLFLLLLSLSSFSQEGFSKAYDFDNAAATFFDMDLDGDHIVLMGNTRIDSIDQWGVFFTRMDTLGNILDYQVYLDSQNDWMVANTNNGLTKLSNGGFALSATPFSRQAGIVIMIDSIGNMVTTYEYPDSLVNSIRQKKILELEDEGYLITGYKQYPPDVLAKTYVMKIDLEGNKLWEKSYGIPDFNNYYSSLIQEEENKFILGIGVQKPLGGSLLNFKSQSRILVLDSLGEIQAERITDFSEKEGGAFNIHNTSDGGYIYSASYLHIFDAWNTADQQKIVRLDSNLNVVWSKIIGLPIDPMNHLWDLEPTPDGDWVAFGNETTPLDNVTMMQDREGRIFKITDSGDSLWNRFDTIGWHPIGAARDYFTGGVVLSSGSIIACGYYDFYDPPKSFAWLYKVNKNGCLTPDDCAYLPVYVPYLEEENFFQIFPNPASEVLNIYFKSNHKRKEGLFRLVDINGRIVFELKAEQNDLDYKIPLKKYTSGIYFLQYIQEGILMKLEKVIIQK